MTRGGTPAEAMPVMRAVGVSPCFFTAASEAISMAAAPSLTPEALPAVIVPGWRTNGLSLASASAVVSGRRCSSLLDRDRAGLAARHHHRLDLLGKESRACAFAARCCERSAKASWSLRAT